MSTISFLSAANPLTGVKKTTELIKMTKRQVPNEKSDENDIIDYLSWLYFKKNLDHESLFEQRTIEVIYAKDQYNVYELNDMDSVIDSYLVSKDKHLLPLLDAIITKTTQFGNYPNLPNMKYDKQTGTITFSFTIIDSNYDRKNVEYKIKTGRSTTLQSVLKQIYSRSNIKFSKSSVSPHKLALLCADLHVTRYTDEDRRGITKYVNAYISLQQKLYDTMFVSMQEKELLGKVKVYYDGDINTMIEQEQLFITNTMK